MPTRTLVIAGLIAAAYATATIALAPLSFGPLQLRVAGLLKPLALAHPAMSLALAIGVALANLTSPFGFYDILLMPIVTYIAARLSYTLRRRPTIALLLHAGVIAISVAVFPLHLGAGIPIWPAIAFIFTSESTLYLLGYFSIWRTHMELFQ